MEAGVYQYWVFPQDIRELRSNASIESYTMLHHQSYYSINP
jgi:hypothetical protein